MDGNAKDATPNSNHGTVTEAILTTDRKGQSNKAYDFDGTNDFVQVADNNIFSFGNSTVDSPFSVSAWFKADSVSGTAGRIVSKRDGGISQSEWFVDINNTYPRFVLWDKSTGGYRGRESQTALATATWTHLVAVYGGDETNPAADIDIYINGVATDDADVTNSPTGYTAMENSTARLVIGAEDNSGASAIPFNGSIDDARIYNRALSPTEVMALYESY